MNILSKIVDFVKAHIDTILPTILIILFVLFSFACGYIMATWQARAPIEIIQTQ